MLGRWLHPMIVLFAAAACLIYVLAPIEALYGLVDSLCRMRGTEGFSVFRIDWPYVISGLFWMMLFSVCIMICIVNVFNLIKCGTSHEDVDINLIMNLTKKDTKELSVWLNENTYGPEHLKELWAEQNHV